MRAALIEGPSKRAEHSSLQVLVRYGLLPLSAGAPLRTRPREQVDSLKDANRPTGQAARLAKTSPNWPLASLYVSDGPRLFSILLCTIFLSFTGRYE